MLTLNSQFSRKKYKLKELSIINKISSDANGKVIVWRYYRREWNTQFESAFEFIVQENYSMFLNVWNTRRREKGCWHKEI